MTRTPDINEQVNAAIRGMEGKMTVEAGADKEMIASKWRMNKAMKLFHVQFRGKDFYANEHATGLIIMLYDLWSGGYSTEGIYDGITPVVDKLRDKPEVMEVAE